MKDYQKYIVRYHWAGLGVNELTVLYNEATNEELKINSIYYLKYCRKMHKCPPEAILYKNLKIKVLKARITGLIT